MRHVVSAAYELVDLGLMNEDDFRDFTFNNVVELHTQMNPEFFKGTAVEGAADKRLAETAPAAVA